MLLFRIQVEMTTPDVPIILALGQTPSPGSPFPGYIPICNRHSTKQLCDIVITQSLAKHPTVIDEQSGIRDRILIQTRRE